MILRYDGSLTGFLCLVGKAIKERLPVSAVIRDNQPASGDLFATERAIDSDPGWAARVAGGLETRLGKTFMTNVAQALFSEEDGIELDLIHFLRRALKTGPALRHQLTDPLVNHIDAAARLTARERHRLLGLLRFVQLADGSYLARVEPRCNVVPLLGGHFAKRLGEQRWLIVDLRRQLGVWGEAQRYELVEEIVLPEQLPRHEEEKEIAGLWRSFYETISNIDRHNPKLRQQFMPKRYWTYLTELQPETAGWTAR